MLRENNNNFRIPELGQSFIHEGEKKNPAWQAATWNQRQLLDLKPAFARKATEGGKRKFFDFRKINNMDLQTVSVMGRIP